jgi:probable F420-dependent oxidoreductase
LPNERPRLALSLTVSGLGALYGGDLAAVVDLARRAEDAGLDQIALPDHLAIGPRTDRYPYGRFPLPQDEPWLEPMTTLAAMAAATTRIRLATGVLLAALRPPLLLAKTAATLDVLSRGRLDLGVGAGWQEEEFAGSGVPFAARFARLEEALRACRALWRGAPASFEGVDLRFEGLRALPLPVQPDGPPLWFGLAARGANLRRIAELGAGWMPLDSSPAALRDGLARLRPALDAAGRSGARFGVRAHAPIARGSDGRPDLERSLADLPALAEAGATHASFALGVFCRARSDVDPFLARLGRAERA